MTWRENDEGRREREKKTMKVKLGMRGRGE